MEELKVRAFFSIKTLHWPGAAQLNVKTPSAARRLDGTPVAHSIDRNVRFLPPSHALCLNPRAPTCTSCCASDHCNYKNYVRCVEKALRTRAEFTLVTVHLAANLLLRLTVTSHQLTDE
ncbi:hypothetical protein RRG08_009002 [Elysia crispata]|uniref:Uncharacterized protein n=1 Tax=Elysia crispata TaxID=231223 RepID=A0AAE0YUC0_9GAST|nr:hypothetical protein RRG08_009002 [Elysia crispata]